MLYLLLTPTKLTTINNGEMNEYNIGYGLGPGLTLLNMAIAGSANSSFLYEMDTYDLYNLIIPDGETAYGLIGLSNYSFSPLTMEIK